MAERSEDERNPPHPVDCGGISHNSSFFSQKEWEKADYPIAKYRKIG